MEPLHVHNIRPVYGHPFSAPLWWGRKILLYVGMRSIPGNKAKEATGCSATYLFGEDKVKFSIMVARFVVPKDWKYNNQ